MLPSLIYLNQLTIQHRNDGLPQGEDQAQWRAEQEKVGHLEVEPPLRASIQHRAAARPARHRIAPQNTGV